MHGHAPLHSVLLIGEGRGKGGMRLQGFRDTPTGVTPRPPMTRRRRVYRMVTSYLSLRPRPLLCTTRPFLLLAGGVLPRERLLMDRDTPTQNRARPLPISGMVWAGLLHGNAPDGSGHTPLARPRPFLCSESRPPRVDTPIFQSDRALSLLPSLRAGNAPEHV